MASSAKASARDSDQKTVRLDKWLQVARCFKTRSQATRACSLGRVRVNDQIAKARRIVRLEDKVAVEYRHWQRVLVVKELHDRPLPKKEVPRIFEDLSPPKPQADPLAKLMRRAPVLREPGSGRPSKKERRQLDELRDDWGLADDPPWSAWNEDEGWEHLDDDSPAAETRNSEEDDR